MPNMNGYQVIQKLKKDEKYLTVPFVFLSGLKKEIEIIKGLKSGADDYLTKPFEFNELIRIVNEKIEKKEKIDTLISDKLEDIKKSLSYSVPHEMITPLNGILGPISMIVESGMLFDESELKELHNVIFLSSKRLKNTIEKFIIYNELISYSDDRINHERIDVSRVIIDLTSELMLNYDRDSDIKINIDLPEINTSKRFLSACIRELFSNCLKFSNPGQEIKISSNKFEHVYCLEFYNQGIGMSEEEINKISSFTQFNRRQQEQQGIGLGISIVKMICNILKYKLIIESEKNKYSKISIEIPIV